MTLTIALSKVLSIIHASTILADGHDLLEQRNESALTHLEVVNSLQLIQMNALSF